MDHSDNGSRQAMLADNDKPKILGNHSSLEAEWRSNNPKMERREGWWESDKKLRLDRNFSGCFVNIFYILLLLTELLLWVKVRLTEPYCRDD